MAKRQDVKMVWTHGKKGSDDAFFVRASVFMVEQGFQVEFDDTDNISWHLAVYDGDEPIGAARFFLGEDKVWQIGRVCVLENYRGRKLGDKILEACEQKIVELAKGPAQAHLSAQVQAKGFYKKHGYTESGEEYLDEFCPHISMTKQL